MINVKDCKWNDAEHTNFVCKIEHEVYGWIPFCCMPSDCEKTGKELWDRRDELEIAEFEDMRDLNETKIKKVNVINAEKNNLLNNGNVKFKDDVFDIDDTSLLRISGTIQDWKDQIDNGLDESGIIQKWISQTNAVHDLTYSELIELARNMRLRVQSIVFYANVLKAQVSQCSTLEEVDNIKWTFE